MKFHLFILAVFLLFFSSAYAVQPDEVLSDPVLEERARMISSDLRCLVCQNQSIDDSDADLAHDLRLLVRQRLLAGDTDTQVKQYLVDRYGDYILLRPPFKTQTVFLWLAPLILLLIGLGSALMFYRRYFSEKERPLSPLSSEELSKIKNLMSSKDHIP